MFNKKTTKNTKKPLKGSKTVKKVKTTNCSRTTKKVAPKQTDKVNFKKNGQKSNTKPRTANKGRKVKAVTLYYDL